MPEPIDNPLLAALQRSVPLVDCPFDQIGREIGASGDSVLQRVGELRRSGIIREISGIFDAAALGYRQTLVAVAVPPHRLDDAGALAAEHPGVSHCYGRDGAYNLWFTLAVSPASRLGLDKTAAVLANTCGANDYLSLPTLRMFKLQVQFGEGGRCADPQIEPAPALRITRQTRAANGPVEGHVMAAVAPPSTATRPPLTTRQVQAVRALQADLPPCTQPFKPLARQADMSVAELLDAGQELLQCGAMRRYAAVLRHQLVGAAANVLVVWRVESDQVQQAAAVCRQMRPVSHCYLRPAAANWPYNLYTMIHGPTRDACQATIARLAAQADLQDHCELWTLKEYKKSRIRLFTGDEQAWEES